MRKDGLSLIEVIVAIGIIVTALGGSLVLISKSVGRLSIPRNKIVAANLAAEGIEVVRNIRDSNWLDPASVSWDDGLSPGIYHVDYNSVDVLGGGVTDQLYLDPVSGFYSHTSGPNPSPFSRHIVIADREDSESIPYMEVRSIIDWQERDVDKQFIVVDHLYDWFN